MLKDIRSEMETSFTGKKITSYKSVVEDGIPALLADLIEKEA